MIDCLSIYPHNGNCIVRDRKAQKNFSWIYTLTHFILKFASNFFKEVCSKCTASYFIPKTKSREFNIPISNSIKVS